MARIKEAGCAALHGGLKVGDLVLTIDGEDLTGKTAMQLNKLIVGDEGTQAILEVCLHLSLFKREIWVCASFCDWTSLGTF